jgi:hypothetical protein
MEQTLIMTGICAKSRPYRIIGEDDEEEAIEKQKPEVIKEQDE